MPLYNFKCEKCGNIKEVIIPSKDKDNALECEKCKSSMKRILESSAMTKYNGTGFYDTDNRNIRSR